jgi:pyridoxine 5-phosphate synthase
MTRLGVNIDHVATVREARKTNEPDPVQAAFLADLGGAAGIVCHLREDRRHIQDRDLELLRATVISHLNMEMAAVDAMVEIALKVKPDMVTMVPERREEVTTEGGLDVRASFSRVAAATAALKGAGIVVSLFIGPDMTQIKESARAGADFVELHTGVYAESGRAVDEAIELEKLERGAQAAAKLGLGVSAGHGLTYHNVVPVAAIPEVEELNIGHSIVARATMVGIQRAVCDMVELIESADQSGRR